MALTEHDIQKAYFQWAGLQQNVFPELEILHAIPNGGQRHVAVAKKLKAEGVKAGVHDVQLEVARGAFIGLSIEFKANEGKPTAEQIRRADLMMREGWCVVFAWSTEAAIRATIGYLKMMKVA